MLVPHMIQVESLAKRSQPWELFQTLLSNLNVTLNNANNTAIVATTDKQVIQTKHRLLDFPSVGQSISVCL